jgi:D-arabinose 1-dehydrogenase-like Zn-dependent alcohol dehydrogenase
MAVMRVAQVAHATGPLEIVERPIPEPGPGWVRIKVQACGICHSDSVTKEGLLPGIQYPKVPGHEVAGVIDAIGPGVLGWEAGQKVGVGWNGGHCGYCDHCRRGEFFACVRGQITGFSVRSMNETFPFDRVSEGYDRMISGKARFRVVLTISEST